MADIRLTLVDGDKKRNRIEIDGKPVPNVKSFSLSVDEKGNVSFDIKINAGKVSGQAITTKTKTGEK